MKIQKQSQSFLQTLNFTSPYFFKCLPSWSFYSQYLYHDKPNLYDFVVQMNEEEFVYEDEFKVFVTYPFFKAFVIRLPDNKVGIAYEIYRIKRESNVTIY